MSGSRTSLRGLLAALIRSEIEKEGKSEKVALTNVNVEMCKQLEGGGRLGVVVWIWYRHKNIWCLEAFWFFREDT